VWKIERRGYKKAGGRGERETDRERKREKERGASVRVAASSSSSSRCSYDRRHRVYEICVALEIALESCDNRSVHTVSDIGAVGHIVEKEDARGDGSPVLTVRS